MTLVINHSNQLNLSYSQKSTVLLPFNKLSKPNVNNTIYVSLIFKDNPFPRYIKHVATYICGLLVITGYDTRLSIVFVWWLRREICRRADQRADSTHRSARRSARRLGGWYTWVSIGICTYIREGN